MTHNMKNWMVVLLACGALLAGCDDNDEKDKKGGQLPATKTVEAFEKQFPDAENVTWEKKQGYDVAKFTLARSRTAAQSLNSAWYPEGGTACTYTKMEISWEQLQQEAPAVAAAWQASPYKAEGYALDDIDAKTYADAAPCYKLEIELGEIERELVYAQDGTLLAERQDLDDEDEDEEDDPCPQAIFDFIAANLPQAVIVEADREEEGGTVYYQVEIRVKDGEQELLFDQDYEFLFIAVEIDDEQYETALPEAVRAKFLELAPDTESWDDVTARLNIKGETICYALTVEDEQTEKETTYLVDASGTEVK